MKRFYFRGVEIIQAPVLLQPDIHRVTFSPGARQRQKFFWPRVVSLVRAWNVGFLIYARVRARLES